MPLMTFSASPSARTCGPWGSLNLQRHSRCSLQACRHPPPAHRCSRRKCSPSAVNHLLLSQQWLSCCLPPVLTSSAATLRGPSSRSRGKRRASLRPSGRIITSKTDASCSRGSPWSRCCGASVGLQTPGRRGSGTSSRRRWRLQSMGSGSGCCEHHSPSWWSTCTFRWKNPSSAGTPARHLLPELPPNH